MDPILAADCDARHGASRGCLRGDANSVRRGRQGSLRLTLSGRNRGQDHPTACRLWAVRRGAAVRTALNRSGRTISSGHGPVVRVASRGTCQDQRQGGDLLADRVLSRSRGFPPDLLRGLVLTKADVNCLPQQIVSGPRQILDLGDKLWLDPVDARHDEGRAKARAARRRDVQRRRLTR
jgi:hypothetical protein